MTNIKSSHDLREANCCATCIFMTHKSWMNPNNLFCLNEETDTTDTSPIYVCDLFEKGEKND